MRFLKIAIPANWEQGPCYKYCKCRSMSETSRKSRSIDWASMEVGLVTVGL